MKSFIRYDVQKASYYFDRDLRNSIGRKTGGKPIAVVFNAINKNINRNIGENEDWEWPIKYAIMASVE